MIKRHLIPLSISAICIALAFGGDIVAQAGRFDRDGLQAGHVWRLISGHLVHLGWWHLAMNVLALAILSMLFEELFSPARWLRLVLVVALTIDAGLWFFESDLEWYVGLSGVLHGVMLAGGLVLLLQRELIGALVVLCVIAKLAWEQIVGPLPLFEATSSGTVIVAAHLYGALGGLLWALASALARHHVRSQARTRGRARSGSVDD